MVVAYLQKEGGTRSHILCILSWDIGLLYLCQQRDTRPLVGLRYILSCRNVLANELSHSRPLTTEWQLDPALFHQIHYQLPSRLVCNVLQCSASTVCVPLPDLSAVEVYALSQYRAYLLSTRSIDLTKSNFYNSAI